MGKKLKTGKQRLDRFYYLAKETGFRSRAAFKLIQLNRKYEFLQKSRVCVDLCAAPGGWLQVVKQTMPSSSVIIGIDLYPIKPIPGCLTYVEDITSEKCRQTLTRELQAWKVDVFLHDGSPNIGKNWLYDAYQQVCLALSALKLATQFLRKGGWFVTKVFRCKDYNSFLWVLKQLFVKVYATKPQASRHESAEMFIVCQNYKAPDKIDSRFLDHKHVFKDFDSDVKDKVNILHPEKRSKRKALGYDENEFNLYKSLKATDFIKHNTGVELLESITEITLDDPSIMNHSKTTPEIKECCKDIKVLGRKDLKALMIWRNILHKELYSVAQEIDEDKEKAEADFLVEDEDKIEKVILEQENEALREGRRKRKRIMKERRKLNERLNLKMISKTDSGPTLLSEEMFDLKQIKSMSQVDQVYDQSLDVIIDDPLLTSSRTSPINECDSNIINSNKRNNNKNVMIPVKSNLRRDDGVLNSAYKLTENEIFKDECPLLLDLDDTEPLLKRVRKTDLWFERDIFQKIDKMDEEDADLGQAASRYESSVHSVDSTIYTDNHTDTDEESECSSGTDENKHGGNSVSDEMTIKNKKLDVDELVLGTLMVHSKKVKRNIIDDAWNRYTFNDESLPSWFVEDEKKHMTRDVVPKTSKNLLVDAKLDDIIARPIKKVIEAKARKKKRALRKMERMKKKIDTLMDNIDPTNDRDKVKQIKELYRRAKLKPKKKVTYVVAKKHMTGKRIPRPKGVKGRYKVVDARLKKDRRAQKRNMERKSKRNKLSKNFRKMHT